MLFGRCQPLSVEMWRFFCASTQWTKVEEVSENKSKNLDKGWNFTFSLQLRSEVIDLHQKSRFSLKTENDFHLMQYSDQPKIMFILGHITHRTYATQKLVY